MLSPLEIKLLNTSSIPINLRYLQYKQNDQYMFVPINFDERTASVLFEDISYTNEDELKYKLSLMFNDTVASDVMKNFIEFKDRILLDTKMALMCNYNPVDIRYAGVKLILLDQDCKYIS